MKALLRSTIVRSLALALGVFTRPAPAQPQRILVIKPDHLGDILLLTPALRALRQSQPQAHVSVLIGSWAERLLADNPDLDAIEICEFPGFVRGAQPSALAPYRLLWQEAARLRQMKFDTALVMRDDHWWGGLLALGSGAGRRIGFAHPLVAPSLTTALAWNPNAHVTQQALDLVAALGSVDTQKYRLRFVPSDEEHAWAAAWLAQHQIQKPLVAIQAGSGGAAKLWPAERWAQVAAQLADQAQIVLTGGPADAADVAAISQQLTIPHLNAVGQANLGQLAALFGRCAVVLGVDTGPLHLAVSQATPTIHLFGPGDKRRFGPWGDPQRHVVLDAAIACSPCGVLTHCPRQTKPSECMTAIAVHQVVQQAKRLLAQAGTSS
ncbi:glycosyltransferase family 9 protein [Herpetosiphon sp. NSE202]|uniref:glycosyltransferase family 9 protein n=1 Tax=Herpetosiphon sp. NSE202 TaxID=3351349 RepID=UPI00363830FD